MSFFNKAIIVLAVSILFYISMIIISDYNIVAEKISSFEFQYLPIILSLVALHLVILAVKFQRLLQKLKINLSFKESLKIFTAGYSLSVTPLGIGSLIKSQILKTKYGNSVSSTMPVVLIERWTELIAILVIVTILLFWFDTLEARIILAIGYVFIFLIFMFTSNSRFFSSTKKIFMKIKYLSKLSKSIDESQSSFKILIKKNNFLEAISYSLVAKFVQLVMVYLIFVAVGIDFNIFQSGQIYYTSLLIGLFSFIPSGVIVTETSMISILMNNNINFSLATFAVIIIRFLGLWLHTIIGTIFLRSVFKK